MFHEKLSPHLNTSKSYVDLLLRFYYHCIKVTGVGSNNVESFLYR